MYIYLKPLNPVEKAKYKNKICITEWKLQPLLSVMSIANHRCYENTGSLPVPYDYIENLSYNHGFNINDANACLRIGSEMLKLINSPDILTDYGMKVYSKEGTFFYTYPLESCTGCFEVKYEQKTSIYWINEDMLNTLSKFIRDSGGITTDLMKMKWRNDEKQKI